MFFFVVHFYFSAVEWRIVPCDASLPHFHALHCESQEWFDYPLQLAAYIHAFNADPMYTRIVTRGLLVIAFSDGHPADVLEMDEKAVGMGPILSHGTRVFEAAMAKWVLPFFV